MQRPFCIKYEWDLPKFLLVYHGKLSDDEIQQVAIQVNGLDDVLIAHHYDEPDSPTTTIQVLVHENLDKEALTTLQNILHEWFNPIHKYPCSVRCSWVESENSTVIALAVIFQVRAIIPGTTVQEVINKAQTTPGVIVVELTSHGFMICVQVEKANEQSRAAEVQRVANSLGLFVFELIKLPNVRPK